MSRHIRSSSSPAAAVLLVCGLAVTAGCGSPPAESEPPATAAETTASPTPVGAGESRIAYAPTPDDGLPAAVLGTAPPPRGRVLQYVPGDEATRGYLALPAGPGPHPALILVHEWDGLNDRIRQVADAFAAEGYVALAADLYRSRTGSNPEENMALVKETRADMGRVVSNLDTAAQYLRDRDDTTGRIAVMGWCFGGGIALSYGLDGEAHEGTAIFYGQLVQDPEVLKRITHEVYGTFAEADSGIPPAEVEKFVAALRAAGVPNDVHIYDAVDHGFWLWVDREPGARSAPALDAWQRLKHYLSRTLGPEGTR